jgi:hypothetical protein
VLDDPAEPLRHRPPREQPRPDRAVVGAQLQALELDQPVVVVPRAPQDALVLGAQGPVERQDPHVLSRPARKASSRSAETALGKSSRAATADSTERFQ